MKTYKLEFLFFLINILCFIFLGIGAGIYCGGTEQETENPAITDKWEEYSKPLQGNDIQEECRPLYLKADPNVDKKGSVVLFHGFTACPQQYFELSREILQKEGYDVYLPLLPGHGKLWKDDLSDISEVPNHENWKEIYGSFLETMFGIINEAAKPVSIGGLSLGGELALWATREKPGLFKRAILFAPFLGISNEGDPLYATLDDFVIPLVAHLPFRKDAFRSWGPGCYVERNIKGRAGNCHFTVSQLLANVYIGNMLLEEGWKAKTAFHFVTVGKDPAADNEKIYKLIGKLKEEGNTVHHVEYPYPVSHSMLSRFDGPVEENKFWLPHLLENIRNLFKNDSPMSPFEIDGQKLTK